MVLVVTIAASSGVTKGPRTHTSAGHSGRGGAKRALWLYYTRAKGSVALGLVRNILPIFQFFPFSF